MSKKIKYVYADGGIGFCGALAILFIALKLCNQIDWSWWWVTCPIWDPFAIFISVAIIVLIGIIIHHFVMKAIK